MGFCTVPLFLLRKVKEWYISLNPDTYAESHIMKTSTTPGAAAHRAAQKMTDKYTPIWAVHTSSTHLPWRQLVHGMRWPLSWHERLADASPQSLKIPEKQPSCFNVCPWLSNGGMWSPSRTSWPSEQGRTQRYKTLMLMFNYRFDVIFTP